MRTYTVSSALSVIACSGKWVMYLAPAGIAVTVYNCMHSRHIYLFIYFIMIPYTNINILVQLTQKRYSR